MTWRQLGKGYLKICFRFDWALVALSLVLSAVFFPPAASLFKHISTNLRVMLPKDYSSVDVIETMDRHFKSYSNVILTFEIPESPPEKLIAMMEALAQVYRGVPAVDKVTFTRPGFDYLDPRKWLYLDLSDLAEVKDRVKRRIEREKLGGLYIDFEDESAEGEEKAFLSDVTEKYGNKYDWKEKRSLKEDKRFLETVLATFSHFPAKDYVPDLKVYVVGDIKTRIDEFNALTHDLTIAGIVSIVLIVAVLFVYFRSFGCIALLMLILFQSVEWSFGISAAFLSNLNIVTSFLFSILFGLGIDIGIHLFSRYREERGKGLASAEALLITWRHIVPASSYAALTTLVGFFLLMVNDFKGFSEFGLIAGIGILMSMAGYFLFFPAYIHFFERFRLLHLRPPLAFPKRLLPKWSRYPNPKWVLCISGVIFVFFAIGLKNFYFEYDFKKLKAYIEESALAREKFHQTTTGVSGRSVVLFKTPEERAAIAKAIAEKQTQLGADSIVYNFRTFADLIPEQQEEKMQIVREIATLLEDDALKLVKGKDADRIQQFRDSIADNVDRYVVEGEIPQEAREQFFASDDSGLQRGFIRPAPELEMDNGHNAIKFRDQVHTLHTDEGTFHVSSDTIIFADVLTTLIRDSRVAITLSLLSMFCFLWLDARSARGGAALFGFLLLGLLASFGIMGWIGLPLNFYNIIAIPIMVGMGEDTLVHFFHRFKEERGKNPQERVWRVLKTSGIAALFCMLTTVFGFFSLAIAQHQGLRGIGIAANIGLVLCYLTAVFPILAALVLYARYLDKKEKPNLDLFSKPST